MFLSRIPPILPGLVLALVFGLHGSVHAATTNRWINNGSGLWRDPANWSSNQPPNSTFNFTLITNSGTKIVTIDALTAATNLAIQRLTLTAPSGSTNTLELIDLTTNQPLLLSSTLLVGPRAELRLTNSALNINGFSGGILDLTGGTMLLENGLLDCTTITAAKIGDLNSGTATLTVNGGNALFSQVQLGALSGSRGVLLISNGVVKADSIFSLGDRLNSTGTVSIAGGQLIATNDITKVGNSGKGQLSLSAGLGQFAFLSVGDNLNSSGAVTLSGGLLKLTPRTTNDWLRIGNLGNGTFDIVGGTALVGSEFHLGDDLVSTGIVRVTGGHLIATNEITAIGRYGVGEMLVSNATVQLTNASVGRHDGAIGTLTVQSNALFSQVDDLSIGRFPNSIGHVVVTGGLLGLTNDNVFVGREGYGDLMLSSGTIIGKAMFVALSTVVIDPNSGLPVTNTPAGSLTLAGGNLVLSSNLLVGSDSISTGQVAIAGGNLTLAGGSGSGTIAVQCGTFALSQGTVNAGQLLVTNSTASFNFTGGILACNGMAISNGAPFVVGDGVNPAVLQLRGGVYSFADGLVISSNATVAGCGTLLGAITNFGTLATNCGPRITELARTGTTVTVYFTTLPGSNHILEFKNSLGDAGWTQILPGIAGTGGILSQTDSNATVAARFYRVHLQ